MELPTHEKVLFPDNELILLKFNTVSEWNNAVVISTGDNNKYKVQKSIRRGIVANLYMTYFEVVHLVLEMYAQGATFSYNYLFPGGFQQCIEIGAKEFNKLAETDELYAQAKSRIHTEWDSLTLSDTSGNNIKEVEKPKSVGGITGISHPTGH